MKCLVEQERLALKVISIQLITDEEDALVVKDIKRAKLAIKTELGLIPPAETTGKKFNDLYYRYMFYEVLLKLCKSRCRELKIKA